MTQVAGRTDVGRMRENNEDRYLALRRGATTLLAVADGVGGEVGGEIASAAAVESLAATFDFAAQDASTALAAAMRAANDAVLKAGRENGVAGASSTLVAAAVRGRQTSIANLGDSRAYVVSRGIARQITQDHSGAMPNSITRFVGDPRGVWPDVFVEALRPHDRLVLCSDGLTLHLEPGEIAAAVSRVSPERAADALVAQALERGGGDNVTVIVYAARPRRAPLIAAGLISAAILGLLAGAAALGALR